jgi:hypothetical protein
MYSAQVAGILNGVGGLAKPIGVEVTHQGCFCAAGAMFSHIWKNEAKIGGGRTRDKRRSV